MKSGFCSRGVHIFDGCERLRVPTKSGLFFFVFFLCFWFLFFSPGLVLPKAVLEREEN